MQTTIKVNKEQLKQFIKNNYSGNYPELLIQWINSANFEKDLSLYIEQDLFDQIEKGNPNKSVNLDHIVDEILSIVKLQEEGLKLNDSSNQIIPDENGLRNANQGNRKKIWLKPALKVAASLALIISTIFIYIKVSEYNLDKASGQFSYQTKENPKGRKSTIFLKDGSKVILNSESSISYDENFSSGIREIELKGEAFFEVVKNPEQPFVVRSGGISTVALGTSFNVRNYGEENITVSLVTGKVRIDKKGNQGIENILMPGEKLTYIRETEEFEKQKYNDYGDLLWKDGILSFKKASVSDVVANLERWYGVEIEIVVPGNKKVSYGGVFKDQNLKQVLEAVGFTLNFDYSIDGKKVKIMFN
ncbi:FecR domain-containing protein [Reichenbachiella sp. MALMAid0571]|uniref:FecR family protein n=1 Tax=Reichenbachiella sp. MALMAid0571 TaxID=3143939 RepID=UPI0032E0218A